MNAQARGAQELVERARMGDQNAMGILQLVGENARHGDPKAKTAYLVIRDFIQRHPVKGRIGPNEMHLLGILKEPNNAAHDVVAVLCRLPAVGNELMIQAACAALAQGPAWSKNRLQQADASIHGPGKQLFRFGISYPSDDSKLRSVAQQLPPEGVGYLCAGHCIGSARRIQMAKVSHVPFHRLVSADVGWELGL